MIPSEPVCFSIPGLVCGRVCLLWRELQSIGDSSCAARRLLLGRCTIGEDAHRSPSRLVRTSLWESSGLVGPGAGGGTFGSRSYTAHDHGCAWRMAINCHSAGRRRSSIHRSARQPLQPASQQPASQPASCSKVSCLARCSDDDAVAIAWK